MKQKIWMLAASAVVLLASCRKKADPVTPTPVNPNGSMQFKFSHNVDGTPLVLETGHYANENGDSFSVRTFNYYLSNIKLETDSGVVFTEPESYHLLRSNADSSLSFTIADMPPGHYKSITFMMGVDSIRNITGAQTGALDVSYGMFWGWNTGYIMSKFEGTFLQHGGATTSLFYHLGGYKGTNSVLRTVTLQFPATANVTAAHTPVVNMSANLAEWFKTPSTIDFSTVTLIMNGGYTAALIADNYTDMLTVDHIDN
ncbi:MbnP family protein [Chitinophagaceae bacterium MMS25-I14]